MVKKDESEAKTVVETAREATEEVARELGRATNAFVDAATQASLTMVKLASQVSTCGLELLADSGRAAQDGVERISDALRTAGDEEKRQGEKPQGKASSGS